MKSFHKLLIVICLLLTGVCLTVQQKTRHYPIIKEARSDKGIVVTAHPIASHIGTDILQKGGNAIDAAIAVFFALAVVYPEAGNIGGGGFMIYRDSSGNSYALDFREKAPALTNQILYLNNQGELVDSFSQEGIFSIGVPGSIDGIFQIFYRFSKLKDISVLMQAAIDLAAHGYPLSSTQAKNLNQLTPKFKAYNKSNNPFTQSSSWKTGDLFIQKDLANTLRRIAKNGRDEFYKGQTSNSIISTMKDHGKHWIQKKDLLNYQSVWREVIQYTYKDYQILSMPPPSSGGIHLAQLFGMYALSGYPKLIFHSSKHIQLFTEFQRRVYADRAKYLGDPDFFTVPTQKLLDQNYLLKSISTIDLQKASDSKSILHAHENINESEETTHFSIIDRDKNAVSITTTLNGAYGSFVLAKGCGFLLNNEMDDFSIKPGVPNLYGLIGSKANAIAPFKRMLSSMTPTIVTKNNTVEYILGSPGGSTIITTVFQILMNLIEFKMNPFEAVQSNRFHHQLFPDCIYFEEGYWDPDLLSDLKSKHYPIKKREAIGRVELIARDGNTANYIGVADRRGDDSVATYKNK